MARRPARAAAGSSPQLPLAIVQRRARVQRHRCGRCTFGRHPLQERQLGAELRQHPEQPVRQTAHERIIETCAREQDDVDGQRMYGLINAVGRSRPESLRHGRRDTGFASRSTPGPRIGTSRAPCRSQPSRVVIGNARNREGGIERVSSSIEFVCGTLAPTSCTSPGENSRQQCLQR